MEIKTVKTSVTNRSGVHQGTEIRISFDTEEDKNFFRTLVYTYRESQNEKRCDIEVSWGDRLDALEESLKV